MAKPARKTPKPARKDPWYKQPSIVISLAAFVISVVTTATSAYRTYRQDVETRKTQLRALVLQLNSGQIQAVELYAKHQNDPALGNIASVLNVQNIITAKQAYSLVKEIGRDASSMDFGIVAYSLTNIGELALAEEIGLKALERATNATEYLGATRALAQLKMSTGQSAEAEVYYKKALNVYDIYPKDTINEQNVHNTHAWTQMSWAAMSATCDQYSLHMAKADAEIALLDPAVAQPLIQYRNGYIGRCSGAPPAQGAAQAAPPAGGLPGGQLFNSGAAATLPSPAPAQR